MAASVEPPMVGRVPELALVDSAISAGSARAVVVAGPPGVGKSRLLRESVRGTGTATALASPLAPVPFGVIRDLVGEEAVAHDGRADTIRRYVAAVRRLPAPVVVVEDLHWADADSLAVLVDFARTPDGPVLLATTRDEPRRALTDALALLSSTPGVRVVMLSGLSTGEVAALVGAVWGRRVPVRVAAELRRRTDGLPYWVEELARSVDSPADLLAAALPGVASGAMLSRLDAEGAEVRAVAEVASVLGQRVELDLVGRVADRPVSGLLPAFRSLVDHRIVVEHEPGRFMFRHALTREAVASRVPDVQRREWHRRAYEVLAGSGAPAVALAQHAAGAALRAEALSTAGQAASDLLAAGSGADALRLAELALGFDPRPAWPLAALAARAAYMAGYFDEAEPHAGAWRDGAAAIGAWAEVADAECLRASLRWHAGDRPGQWAALDAAETAAEAAAAAASAEAAAAEVAASAAAGVAAGRASAQAQARVLAARANAFMRAERPDEAIREADRALAAAAATGADAARRSALVDKGTALCASADAERRRAGLELLAQAEAESEAARDVVTLARALNNGLEPRLRDHPYAQQWALYDETWQRATSLGLLTSLGKMVRQAVDLADWTGQWARGWEAVMARLPEETDRVERVVLGGKAALLALEADRGEEAAVLAERATAEATGIDQYWAVLYLAVLDVALTARRSAPAATIRALGRYRRAVSPAEHPMRPWQAWRAARYALDSGVPAPAIRAFLRAALPAGLPEPVAIEAELALCEAAGDHRRAVDAGERLLRTDLGAVQRADTLTRLGRARLGLGRPRAAEECAEEARALLVDWPPGPKWRAVEALSTAVTNAGPALTNREKEIRSLVSAGLSNQDIADRLAISPRTVAVHVSRLLTKTGCASRTELAVRALRAP